MLTHPTLDQLRQLGLIGMAARFEELPTIRDGADLDSRRMARPAARPRDGRSQDKRLGPIAIRRACATTPPSRMSITARARGLDRALFQKLARATGSTPSESDHRAARPASGKVVAGLCTWATGPAATSVSVLYQRVPRLFAELAPGARRRPLRRLMRGLARAQLLILDDWGLEPLDRRAATRPAGDRR